MSTLARPRTVRTSDDVAALGTILGIWAHPDDEMYLSAEVMAAAVAAGNRVVVVTATRGERGTDDPGRWPTARLAGVRIRELAGSLAVLDGGTGRIEHRFLGDRDGVCYLDGGLAIGPADRAVAELTGIVDEVAPDTILTFGPDGMTGHPDHRAVSAWTERAAGGRARVLHATLTAGWVREFEDQLEAMDDGDDAFPVTPRERLDVDLELAGTVLDRKVAALEAHATQVRPLLRLMGAARYRRSVAGEWFTRAPAPRSRMAI